MPPLKEEIEAALYTDESGAVIGLDEVQLLEHPPEDRIATLHQALSIDDLELQYRAALVLAAWGDDQGLHAIERFIDNRIDQRGIAVVHRIYGYNNLFDEMAYAVYLYSIAGHQLDVQKRIYKKLLSLYGPCEFAFKLKYALLECEYPELIGDVEEACQRSLDAGKHYLASQLLPVLAKWNPAAAHQLFPEFIHDTVVTPNPTTNVVEALQYMETGIRDSLLQKFAEHPDSVVANEARQAIKELQA